MFKLIRKGLKNQKGFTLVELMVVVVIIGILVGIAVPTYRKVTGSAEEKACLANQRTIEGAAQVYKVEEGKLPTDLDDLTDDTDGDPYLQTEPKCPTTNNGYTIDTDGIVSCVDHPKSGSGTGGTGGTGGN